MLIDLLGFDRLVRAVETVLVLGSAWFFLLSVTNVLWLRLATSRARTDEKPGCPRVSVLIPARNEEANLAACLESLVTQTYPDYEILVLDDESTDATWRIAADYARRYPNLVRVLRGDPLPPDGWCGKPHAMQQLAARATGEYLYFTDADTRHRPHSIAWAVTNMRRHRADLLSGYPAQTLGGLGEAMVIPAMYMMSALILPLPLVALRRARGVSFAIGQVMVFRRDVFNAVGGYAAVRDRITDDLAMAHVVKSAGFRTVFLDAKRALSCRMYRGYQASLRGLSKNIYDISRNGRALFAFGVLVLVVFVLLPLVLAAAQAALGVAVHRPLVTAAATLLLAWCLTLYDRGHDVWLPLTYPLFFLHLLYMALRMLLPSAARTSLLWKGRVLR